MQVIITRSVPGSGKSTWTHHYKLSRPEGSIVCICSADDFHIDPVTKKYDWKAENQTNAHLWCLRCFTDFLVGHTRPAAVVDWDLIVDNTNLRRWEIQPYYQLALAYKAPVLIKTFHCTFEESVSRNVHSVPHSTLEHMFHVFGHETLPKEWNVEHVNKPPKSHLNTTV